MENTNGDALEASLVAWDRHNSAILNLLDLIPLEGWNAKIFDDSKMVCQMFSHVYHERMISVLENAPEFARVVPNVEWYPEQDRLVLASQLKDSAKRVRDAVEMRTRKGQAFDRDYAHPLHFLSFMIFHEGYHHGQIKSSLKAAGCPLSDDEVGPLIWDVWRAR